MTEKHEQRAIGRFARIGWRSGAIAGSAALLGFVALVSLRDPAPESARYAVVEADDVRPSADPDPLRTELVRCRTLPATSDDAGCRAAWEVNRRRFMGESRSFVAPAVPETVTLRAATPAAEPQPAATEH